MLGNLGYSSINCDSSPVRVGHVGMQCNFGTIGEIYDFGLHDKIDEDTFDMCVK